MVFGDRIGIQRQDRDSDAGVRFEGRIVILEVGNAIRRPGMAFGGSIGIQRQDRDSETG